MILWADARRLPLRDESVHMCATSPPYWSQRDYKVEPAVWGGSVDCSHDWQPFRFYQDARTGNNGLRDTARGATVHLERWRDSDFCARCAAWRGQLGLEPTPGLYVDHLVEVAREIRRVLRPEGTFWLVLGDTYYSAKGSYFNPGGVGNRSWDREKRDSRVTAAALPTRWAPNRMLPPAIAAGFGLKPKDLVGVPWWAAFALRADGWYLRAAIVWHKPNPIPTVAAEPHPEGRWPPNVLLSHTAECRPAGRVMVRSDGHHPASRGPGGLGTAGHGWQSDLQERAAGQEEVEAWICTRDCPVAALDAQSGTECGAFAPVQGTEPSGSFDGPVYGEHKNRISGPFYGDSGGASRFFPIFAAEDGCWLCGLPANGAAQGSRRHQAIDESGTSTALLDAHVLPLERLVHHVRAVGGLCASCAIGFARSLAATSRARVASVVGLDSIPTRNARILMHSLALIAASQAPSGIMPTIPNLKLWCGYVAAAINGFITSGLDGDGADHGPPFIYQPKADHSERDIGCEDLPWRTAAEMTDSGEETARLNSPRTGAGRTRGARNFHPTVKPLALVRWLVRLVAAPGQRVLDPFAGSGTTGMAAKLEGVECVLIEREPDYVAIAERRIAAVQQPALLALAECGLAEPVAVNDVERQLSLLP